MCTSLYFIMYNFSLNPKLIFHSLLLLITICSLYNSSQSLDTKVELDQDIIKIDDAIDFIDDGTKNFFPDLKIKERYLQGAYNHTIKISTK